jgi:hypothetical protein
MGLLVCLAALPGYYLKLPDSYHKPHKCQQITPQPAIPQSHPALKSLKSVSPVYAPGFGFPPLPHDPRGVHLVSLCSAIWLS